MASSKNEKQNNHLLNESEQSHDEMIQQITKLHFDQVPKNIERIDIGICNEVYLVRLKNKEIVIRMSPIDKFLKGSSDHIPKFKLLGIKVPDILIEDYSKIQIPLSYQIQSKIEGKDLGKVIEMLTKEQ